MKRQDQISDVELARLLSGRDGLSVIEKERLRESILDAVLPVALPWWRSARRVFSLGVLSTAAAAAMGLLVFRTVTGDGSLSLPSGANSAVDAGAARRAAEAFGDEFIPRGGAHGATMSLACLEGAGSTSCRRGTKLVFRVRSSSERHYFASFAQDSSGSIFWYFPGPMAQSAALGGDQSLQLLDSAVVLSSEAQGDLTVYGVFSTQPLTRDQIKKALGPELRGDGSVEIVKRTVRVEELE